MSVSSIDIGEANQSEAEQILDSTAHLLQQCNEGQWQHSQAGLHWCNWGIICPTAGINACAGSRGASNLHSPQCRLTGLNETAEEYRLEPTPLFNIRSKA